MGKQQQSLLDSVMWHIRSWDEIKSMSFFTMSNYVNIALVVSLLVMAVLQARSKVEKAKKDSQKRVALPSPNFPDVDYQDGFDWKSTEPVKLRPFKPKYHLTMADSSALEDLDSNDLLLMDKNYKDRIDYRRKIIQEHHDVVVAVNDDKAIRPAVTELYIFLLGTYLPTRYPEMFKLHQANYDQGVTFMLENTITGELPLIFPNRSTETVMMLETLGKHLDEDFLLLLPENTGKDPKYVLEAYITVCPSGFNPREKLGKRLRDIHGPVPGYEQKLEGSMDRFFAKVEVGKYVRRVNWSVTTNAELYAAGAGTTHAHEGEETEELDSIDVDKTFVRCERQTLHRLPESKALVFAFKTYLYPIKDIKDEGLGEELAEAIDGLKGGNVPAMHFYKRGAVWGEAVKKYLRS